MLMFILCWEQFHKIIAPMIESLAFKQYIFISPLLRIKQAEAPF